MSRHTLKQFLTDDALARAAAGAWLDLIQSANQTGNAHTVALSGGRITKKFFAETVQQSKTRVLSLAAVQFFWADERCVPPSDAESNYRLARESLFEPLDVPVANRHRVLGEEPPPFAATEAEAEICRLASLNNAGLPVLDLVLLGLGEDGHVASLFPNAGPERENSSHAFFAIEDSPKPPPARVTLSYAAIAAARQVWVLVSGSGKASALRDSLRVGGQTPLARVLNMRKETVIFTDIPS